MSVLMTDERFLDIFDGNTAFSTPGALTRIQPWCAINDALYLHSGKRVGTRTRIVWV